MARRILALLVISTFVLGFVVQAKTSFTFDAFLTAEAIMTDLRTRLPQNPTQEQVEALIVAEGGASKKPHDWRPNAFGYVKKRAIPMGPNDIWPMTAMYYRDGTLRQFTISGEKFYPDGLPRDRADPTVFAFEDYESSQELADTLRSLFPLESPRADFEKVIVDWARASALPAPDDPDRIIYRHEHSYSRLQPDGSRKSGTWAWTLTVSYRADGTIMQIALDGSDQTNLHVLDREYWLRTHNINKQEKTHGR
ncbi:MAG: hypothetical protein E6R12_03540 [Sphingomonadales bacterium]|nr:MAG: hypothetical protein E6R12_03540 [Sphingomonadales bacterium]